MIISIGNDIVSIAEIKQYSIENKGFLDIVFSNLEQSYCESKPNKYLHYAGCFAAKEAIMKALGTGWNEGVQWKHIEIKHRISGEPRVELYYQAKKIADFLKVKIIHLSLSHTEEFATAFAIFEK